MHPTEKQINNNNRRYGQLVFQKELRYRILGGNIYLEEKYFLSYSIPA